MTFINSTVFSQCWHACYWLARRFIFFSSPVEKKCLAPFRGLLRNLIADGIVGTPNEIGWPVGSYIRPRKGVALGEAGVFPKALREMKQQKTEQKEEK